MHIRRIIISVCTVALLATAAFFGVEHFSARPANLAEFQRVAAEDPDPSTPASDPVSAHSHTSLKNADGTWKYTNRLAGESSPYLLQHAHNPVDWYPWGSEAFDAARKTGKPIFLSVGYSTCYWCHVMERLCFEDEDIARQMNELFICIKVDREERPDVDDVYMTATQLMTGQGGWPMNLCLTPPSSDAEDDRGLKPFWAGTYLPPKPMRGRPSLPQLLTAIDTTWRQDPQRAKDIGNQVAAAVRKTVDLRRQEDRIDPAWISSTVDDLMDRYDEINGGFGDAPKFPTPNNLQLLIRVCAGQKNPRVWKAIRKTLDAMAHGGIYDQVGGGFHRYSTDASWLVPHFEKMLYDNGQLVETYLAASDIPSPDNTSLQYDRIVRETCDYILREMTDPSGAFWSAQDAEVDGEEGRNYLWLPTEIEQALGDRNHANLAVRMYGLDQGTNFTDPHVPDAPARNVLFLPKSLAEVAELRGLTLDQVLTDRREINTRLLSARDQRPQPRTDDKVLASWNGMMIAGLARAGRSLEEPRYTEAARRAVDAVLQHMQTEDGSLLHSMRHEQATIPGFLEDYAFLIHGLCELYRTTDDVQYLSAAESLAQIARDSFADSRPGSGGYFDTRADQTDLFVRTRNTHDGATPSANSQMIHSLLDLHELTKKPSYLDFAILDLTAFSGNLKQTSVAMAHMVHALDRAIELAPGRFE